MYYFVTHKNMLFYKGEEKPLNHDDFVVPWFTFKYGSQEQTKGLRTRQKSVEADSLIGKTWFTFKSWSHKRMQNLDLHYKDGSQNRTKKCLSSQIKTTLHCPLLWSSASEVFPLLDFAQNQIATKHGNLSNYLVQHIYENINFPKINTIFTIT